MWNKNCIYLYTYQSQLLFIQLCRSKFSSSIIILMLERFFLNILVMLACWQWSQMTKRKIHLFLRYPTTYNGNRIIKIKTARQKRRCWIIWYAQLNTKDRKRVGYKIKTKNKATNIKSNKLNMYVSTYIDKHFEHQ